MKTFTLEIEMGNEAMQTYADIAHAVKRIFSDMSNRTERVTDDNGRIYDLNGNRVGKWSIDIDNDWEDEDEDTEN